MADRCVDCRFYDKRATSSTNCGPLVTTRRNGLCRKGKPKYHHESEGIKWPTVWDDDWCGKFEQGRLLFKDGSGSTEGQG